MLPIDCTGPITEGIDVLPVQGGGQPLLRADPADGFAGTEIDDMRAAAEGIEAGPGAGQGVLSRVPDYAARPGLWLGNADPGHAAFRHNQSDSRKASNWSSGRYRPDLTFGAVTCRNAFSFRRISAWM